MSKLFAVYMKSNENDLIKYRILYFFNELGTLNPIELVKCFEGIYGKKIENETLIGTFESFEELSRYCFSVSDYYNARSVNIVSIEEFNFLIEKSSNISEFVSHVENTGEQMKNPDSRKSGFFKNMFHI